MLKRKWFLYLTEFFAGMSVMAIELGASRLLAPYFSSSQIVWTIIIGAIMIAMALGNLWGGRSADRNPSPDRLYGRLLIAAVWVAAIPFCGKYVIALISLLLALLAGQQFLIWASLLSCLVLFVFPLMLLGTVSPSLVKYTVNNLGESGKTVGELNALNTVGSIIGTFTPTFLTIPAVGTAWTFLIFAGILLAIALCYFLFERRGRIRAAVAAVLAVIFAFSGSTATFAFTGGETVYEDESIYNYLQVTETEKQISLSTNVLFGVQSVLVKNGKLTGMYYDYALAAPLMACGRETPPRILILGFGTGTYALSCRRYFPGCTIDGVEIDNKIIELAYTRFGVPRNAPDLHVTEFDGRAFLRGAGRYDVIMVDAYRDITFPFQMSSVEFFSEVRDHLTENGVAVINLNMRSQKENSIGDYLCDTVGAAFDRVYVADCEGNREVFAFSDGECLSRFEAALAEEEGEFPRMMRKVNRALTPDTPGKLLLTDDRAPVELLGMRVIDELIAEELTYYKQLLAGHSVPEMIDLLTE